MLRRLLVLGAFALCCIGLSAQTLSLSPLEQNTNGPGNVFEIVGYAVLTNNSSDTVHVGWKRNVVEITDVWQSAICVAGQCYLPTVDSLTFSIPPGEQTDLDVHAYPNQADGMASIQVRLTNLDTGAELLTGTYNFNMPLTSSTEEYEATSAMRVYPNPASDNFYLSDHPSAAIVTLYNLTGRVARTYQVMPGQSYSLDGLPSGLYLAAIHNDRGDLLRTLRVQKRRVGP